MAVTIQEFTITYGEWKKISLAGESGAAWVSQVGIDGSSRVRISHTDSAQTPADDVPWGSATDLNETIGFLLDPAGSISPVLEANNGNDIYYATLLDVDEVAKIQADFN